MRSGNRISGIDIIGDIPWGMHFCQFYQTKEALKVAIPDIDAYLENGQIEIVPHTYCNLEEDALDPQMALNDLVEIL